MASHTTEEAFFNRYLPGADEETRARAREILGRYAAHLIRIGERVMLERRAAGDSTKIDGRRTISPSPNA